MFDIGPLREQAAGGGPFTEPKGEWEELEVLIVLMGLDVKIHPVWHKAILPRRGSMVPVYFNITALRPGVLEMALSFYLSRDSALLEEYRFTLEAVKEIPEALAEAS